MAWVTLAVAGVVAVALCAIAFIVQTPAIADPLFVVAVLGLAGVISFRHRLYQSVARPKQDTVKQIKARQHPDVAQLVQAGWAIGDKPRRANSLQRYTPKALNLR